LKKDGEKLKAGRDMHIDVEKHGRIYYCSNMKNILLLKHEKIKILY
jgi:hypothetical protein